MKKLMMAAAIVCAAVASQAATVNWYFNISGGKAIYKSGSTSQKTAVTTIYLFADGQQDAVLSAIRSYGADWTTYVTALDDATLTSGAWANTSLTTSGTVGDATEEPTPKYIAGTTYKFFGVVYDDASKEAFFTTASGTKAGNGDKTITNNPEAKSQQVAFKYADTYGGEGGKGAGWYATTNVPEPTSGLLLLLGVAGLALKRKRA